MVLRTHVILRSAIGASRRTKRQSIQQRIRSVTERIFDGIKVIDCASFIAGPAAATVMSDFGPT